MPSRFGAISTFVVQIFKMAVRFEVFNKLRELGNTLDKTSSALSSLNDNEPEQNSKARACLDLRAILAEMKSFKDDAKKNIAATKKRLSFDEFLASCEKQAEKMKEDIENLEEHLAKYGFQRQKEKLPEVQVEYLEKADELSESSGQSNSGSPQNNSDKENQPSESEEIDVAEEMAREEATSSKAEFKEPDFLLTPVQPRTFANFMQDPCVEKGADPTHTPDVKEPFPPGTITPMIKPGKRWEESNGITTPNTSSELPAQPATRTPMIKTSLSFEESPDSEATRMNESLADNFPTPPTFATPGLQRYGSRIHGGETLPEHITLETPPPPCFSSIDLLHPDDSHPMATAEDLGSNETDSSAEDSLEIALPNINKETFLRLPGCLQRQFSLEQVNHLIGKTNKYIVAKGDCEPVSDGELMLVLDLGPMTRAFVLLMIKLNYLTIVSNGLYKVM